MIPCMDFLGGAKYPKIVLETLPAGWGVGIFTQKNLFGDAYPLLDKLLSRGKTPLVRLQLSWKSHNQTPSDFPTIVAEARRFVPLVNKYPNVEWQFSGACEHKLNSTQATQLKDKVLAVIPSQCSYVNNPQVGHGAFITGDRVLNEVHGKDAHKPNVSGGYNFSFDGDSCVDCNVTALKQTCSDCKAFFFWDAPYNLNYESNDDPTPIPNRTWKPYAKLVTSIVFTNGARGAVNLPKNFTWKSHAETNKPKPGQKLDPRADHPVLLTPIHGRTATIKAKNGAVIALAPRYKEDFVDGRARFYFTSLWGFEMALKALKLAGSPVCELWIDGKKYGDLNPGFRY